MINNVFKIADGFWVEHGTELVIMVDAFFSEQFGVIGRVQHAIKIKEEVFFDCLFF